MFTNHAPTCPTPVAVTPPTVRQFAYDCVMVATELAMAPTVLVTGVDNEETARANQDGSFAPTDQVPKDLDSALCVSAADLLDGLNNSCQDASKIFPTLFGLNQPSCYPA